MHRIANRHLLACFSIHPSGDAFYQSDFSQLTCATGHVVDWLFEIGENDSACIRYWSQLLGETFQKDLKFACSTTFLGGEDVLQVKTLT